MFHLSGANTTLILGDKITLDGEGTHNGTSSLVVVDSDTTLRMDAGSKITGGRATGDGGSGGAVFIYRGTLTMSGGTISGNHGNNGGGVFVSGGALNMTAGSISGNSSPYGYGGGVYVMAGTFTMTGGTVSSNSVSGTFGYGGGVYIFGGTLTISGGSISGNNAGGTYGYGGGVYIAGTLTYNVGGTIAGNTAKSGNQVYKSPTPQLTAQAEYLLRETIIL
jgi:hypothetical protein